MSRGREEEGKSAARSGQFLFSLGRLGGLCQYPKPNLPAVWTLQNC